MSDILNKLRLIPRDHPEFTLCCSAADEIEYLRAEILEAKRRQNELNAELAASVAPTGKN